MYLKEIKSGDLVEITALEALIDPCKQQVQGRLHAGEELQDQQNFAKRDLVFPSTEPLPRCWLDPDYKRH